MNRPTSGPAEAGQEAGDERVPPTLSRAMDLNEIERLVSLMNENGLARLEVEEEGKRYVMEKAVAPAVMATPMPAAAPAIPAGFAMPAAAAPAEKPAARDDVNTFNSPMVGTFYRAPGPDASAFVKVGDKVGPDSVLCIIEAMKVMNEIQAETSGTVVEILTEDSEAVEYGQPLFLIRPNS